MDIHQTQAYAVYLTSIGWTVEKNEVNDCFAFIRKYPLLPVSILKLQRIPFADIDWKWVDFLEHKHHVLETVVELGSTDRSVSLPDGFYRASDFMLNTKTLMIDLHRDETSLLKSMKPKTRYNIHLTQKHGLTVRIWSIKEIIDNPSLFASIYDLLEKNAKRIGMWLIPKSWILAQYKAFKTQGFVVGISTQDSKDLIAVATFYYSATDCSYNLNGSTLLGRQLMAPTRAVWAGILEAQARGLQRFDFDGLYDERYARKQQRFKGYGRFKEGFGGSVEYYPPMYRKLRWP